MKIKKFIKKYKDHVFLPIINTDGKILVNEKQLESILEEHINSKLKLKEANKFIKNIATMVGIDTNIMKLNDVTLSINDFQEAIKKLRSKLQLKESGNHSAQILIAEVRKQAVHGNNKTWYKDTFVSYDRDKLKKEIEKDYKVKLVKNEADDWPYFTDGGFKYKVQNDSWIIEADAYLYRIV